MNDAEALLAAAQDVLRRDIAGHAKGDIRYKALLSANAVAMAQRELALAGALTAAQVKDISVNEIRLGKADGDHAVADAILREAAIRAYIANPDSLNEQERSAFLPADIPAEHGP